MPEINISYPIVMLDLTDVSNARAIKLRQFLGKFLKSRNIDAEVGYSETDHAMRIIVKSANESIDECNALIHDTIVVWIDTLNITSNTTKKGRSIRW